MAQIKKIKQKYDRQHIQGNYCKQEVQTKKWWSQRTLATMVVLHDSAHLATVVIGVHKVKLNIFGFQMIAN